MRAACSLIASTLSARPNDPSLMRFAPNVLVSTISAPARTYSWCTSATRSGCVMFSASKLLLMNTPLAYSIVPMAPSQTRTRSSRASSNFCIRVTVRLTDSGVEPIAAERLRVDHQVGLRDDIEADRTGALPHRVGELVVVAEQVQARAHRREHVVQDRLAGVDTAASGIERAGRFVSEEHVDFRERFARQDLVADEVAPLVIAALPQLHRHRRGFASLRGRQRRGGRVVPARGKRAAERGH